jgi:hypothetical protein
MTSHSTAAITAYILGSGEENFRAGSSIISIPADSPITSTSVAIVIGAEVPWRHAMTSLRDLADAIENGRIDGPADRFDLYRSDEPSRGAEGVQHG